MMAPELIIGLCGSLSSSSSKACDHGATTWVRREALLLLRMNA